MKFALVDFMKYSLKICAYEICTKRFFEIYPREMCHLKLHYLQQVK